MDVTAKFNFTAAQIKEAKEEVYKHEAYKYKVQGFRDGKAPQKVIEQNYGDVFTEPALNYLFNKGFSAYLKNNPDVIPLDDPEIDLKPSSDGGLEFSAKIEVQPKFTLGKYTGLEIPVKTIKITDKEVEGFIKHSAMERARQIAAPKGHKIEKGNIAVIDFTGYIGDKKFEGGEAQNHQLEIGSNSFIDTFEDQLVGKTEGEKLDVKVTFPKDYHAKDLAGQKAVFKVEIRNILIKEIPAIDDNFAKESSEFNTLDEYKKDIRARLERQTKIESDMRNEQELLKVISHNTKVEVSPKLVDRYYDQIMEDLQKRLGNSGFNIEMYAQYNGMTLADFEKVQRENAGNSAKVGLILDAICKKESLKDFDDAIKFLKEKNKYVSTNSN